MRILSKFKDYYDFVVTEPDNKKFYNRETYSVVFNENNLTENTVFSSLQPNELYHKFGNTHMDDYKVLDAGFISVIAICDKLYQYFQYKNIIYVKYEDIPEDIIKKITPRSRWWKGSFDKNYDTRIWGKDPLKDMLVYKKLGWVLDQHTKEPIKTKLNQYFDCPIVFVSHPKYINIILNPKVIDLGLNKVISPTELYQDIYNWIPYNEPDVPSSPDDMSRYEAKGFDKKTSFRPNMK